ncbi:MAG: DUF1214 domain-containing protein [Rhodobacteraceae bacterium]|nr:DUF1214 domain-containing protein [Paracoccaceae bacterium]
MFHTNFAGAFLASGIALIAATSWAGTPSVDRIGAHVSGDTVKVNTDNFVRADTSGQFDRMLKMTGGINKIANFREPTPLDKQSVIRMNRDTLYSFAIVDISKGAKLTLPDADGRYMSAMIVNQDEYINKVYYEAGTHDLTVKKFDTPYVLVAVRTLVDSSDPADIKQANDLQDKIVIDAVSAEPYTHPVYDEKTYKEVLALIIGLSKFMPDSKATFGPKDKVDAIRHMMGAAFGWGGLPTEDAYYVPVEPNLPVGSYSIEVPKDVPVKAFWSVSVYNKDGYFQKNAENSYNINSTSGTANADGSMTVNLGGCEDTTRINCVPLTVGWNYTVRMYRPEQAIIDGKWVFPSVGKSK